MHGRGCLGIVERREVREDLPSLALAEALLGRLERDRVVQLAPATLAKDAGHERRRGDDVVDGPLVPREADVLVRRDQVVLARQAHLVDARLGDEPVDAGDVILHVVLDQHAPAAVQRRRAVVLHAQVGLPVGRVGPARLVHARVGAAGERRQLRATRVPQHVHEEQPILGRGVAGAEHRARARLPVDVGNAEVVADDRDVVARALGALEVPRLHPEGRVLVEARDVGALQPGHRIREVRVHPKLVVAVGRHSAGRLEGDDVLQACVGALCRGQHVSKSAGVMLAVGLGRSGSHGARRQGECHGRCHSTSEPPR